jgi:hypothetical protein
MVTQNNISGASALISLQVSIILPLTRAHASNSPLICLSKLKFRREIETLLISSYWPGLSCLSDWEVFSLQRSMLPHSLLVNEVCAARTVIHMCVAELGNSHLVGDSPGDVTPCS